MKKSIKIILILIFTISCISLYQENKIYQKEDLYFTSLLNYPKYSMEYNICDFVNNVINHSLKNKGQCKKEDNYISSELFNKLNIKNYFNIIKYSNITGLIINSDSGFYENAQILGANENDFKKLYKISFPKCSFYKTSVKKNGNDQYDNTEAIVIISYELQLKLKKTKKNVFYNKNLNKGKIIKIMENKIAVYVQCENYKDIIITDVEELKPPKKAIFSKQDFIY